MSGMWANTIEMGGADYRYARIWSTRDAAYYLLDNWAKAHLPAYCAAIRICAKAIRGKASHEVACISFMTAVRETNAALVSNRRIRVTDELEREIEAIMAESILAEPDG